jgi:peptidoglycan/LPS O-acetylase OafA/YrhL
LSFTDSVARRFSSLFKGPTLAEVMDSRGPTRGFDYMRLFLSVLVIFYHSMHSSYGINDAFMGGPFRGFLYLLMPMFFTLSGFLVCASLFRTKKLHIFLAHRVLRLVPALFAEVMLSALILGACLTQLPLSRYLTDPQFLVYFGNIFGWIHTHLPGVFTTNPETSTNFSLWTLPYELECYLIICVLSLTGWIRHKRVLLLFVVAVSIAYPLLRIIFDSHGGQFDRVPGRFLVFCFLASATVYLYREKIPLNYPLAGIALVFSIAVMMRTETTFMAALPVTYVTICLGLLHPPKIPVLLSGDYSYALFLFSYPIQQTYTYLFPTYRHWWANSLFTIVVGFSIAALSWFFIEKPVLRHRSKIIAQLERAVSRIKQMRTVRTAEGTGVLETSSSSSSAASGLG